MCTPPIHGVGLVGAFIVRFDKLLMCVPLLMFSFTWGLLLSKIHYCLWANLFFSFVILSNKTLATSFVSFRWLLVCYDLFCFFCCFSAPITYRPSKTWAPSWRTSDRAPDHHAQLWFLVWYSRSFSSVASYSRIFTHPWSRCVRRSSSAWARRSACAARCESANSVKECSQGKPQVRGAKSRTGSFRIIISDRVSILARTSILFSRRIFRSGFNSSKFDRV